MAEGGIVEAAVVALAVACLVEAVIIGVLAGAVPFLWWRLQKLEQQVEKIDETAAEFYGAAGLKEGRQ